MGTINTSTTEQQMKKETIFDKVGATTMIGKKGITANIAAIDHIVQNKIPGSIVECGVWKGGSVATFLYQLIEHNDISRDVYLFDTFAGMSEPSAHDMKNKNKNKNNSYMIEKHKNLQKETHNLWCYAPLDVVKETMKNTKYPSNKINYIKGKVEDTLPGNSVSIKKIAILRLDTDFYESTKVELENLYPKVSSGGMVILDDYGVWQGVRKAVDEYFVKNDISVVLNYIDKPRRYFIKP